MAWRRVDGPAASQTAPTQPRGRSMLEPARARAADGDQPIVETPGLGPGLVWGPEALLAFEGLRDSGVVSFTDLEQTPTGPLGRLDLRGSGGDFAVGLRKTLLRWPPPVRRAPQGTPVVVLPYDFVSQPDNHRLMGVMAAELGDGKTAYLPDGQSRFELTIEPPASQACSGHGPPTR